MQYSSDFEGFLFSRENVDISLSIKKTNFSNIKTKERVQKNYTSISGTLGGSLNAGISGGAGGIGGGKGGK